MLIGLVGKPNIGKSTFFKAATLANVLIANYPFATIKPNHGAGYVKINSVAKDFGKVANPREGFVKGDYRFVPVELMDVAGLVPGAYNGAGMGNQFLDDLRQADVLIHVIDLSGSTNEKGEQVDALSYDPKKDIEFLEIELDMWYLGILNRGWEKFAKTVQQTNEKLITSVAKQLSGLGVTEEVADKAIKDLNLNTEKITNWTQDDLKSLAIKLRQLTKPIIIAANKADIPKAMEKLKDLEKEFPNYFIIPTSAESELALREAEKHELIDYTPGDRSFTITKKGEEKLTEKQISALNFIKTNVLEKLPFGTGVQSVINIAVFDLLEYIAVHPGGVNKLEDSKGNVLPDCFLMPKGTTALDFAFRLHSDFGNNFIKAIDVKTKMTIGKEHLLKHTDIIEIMAGR